MIQTKPTRLLNIFGIYTSCVGDAENMVFDKDEGEYTCPPIKYVIYKRNLNIANMYDTFEPINQLQTKKKYQAVYFQFVNEEKRAKRIKALAIMLFS